MAYRVIEDKCYSSIEQTEDEADGYSVFETIGEAKKYLINDMQQTIKDYQEAIKRIRALKKEDIKYEQE